MQARLSGFARGAIAIALLTSCGSDSSPIAVEPNRTVIAEVSEQTNPESSQSGDRVALLFDGDPTNVTTFDGAVALARLYLPDAPDAQLANAAARLFGQAPQDLAVTPTVADLNFVTAANTLSLEDVAALLAAVRPLPNNDIEAAIANRANAILGTNRLQPEHIISIPGQSNPPVPVLPFVPNQPIDIIVQCSKTFTDTGSLSSLAYFFDFQSDGSVFGQFTVDTGASISLAGTYTYTGDRIAFDLSGTDTLGGLPTELTFSQRTTTIVPRLDVVGYFDTTGTEVVGTPGFPNPPRPIAMQCLTIGHRYNQPPTGLQRFECPDQPTASGTLTNVFEFDVNRNLPGSAFRQQNRYTGLSGVGTPDFIWRSDFGIYRQVDDLAYLDFTLPPGFAPSFPDFVITVAQLRNNGTQLVVNDFPPGQQTCNRQ